MHQRVEAIDKISGTRGYIYIYIHISWRYSVCMAIFFRGYTYPVVHLFINQFGEYSCELKEYGCQFRSNYIVYFNINLVMFGLEDMS